MKKHIGWSSLLTAAAMLLPAASGSAAVLRMINFGSGADSALGNDAAFSGDATNGGASGGMELRANDTATNRNRLAILRFDLAGIAGDKTGAQLQVTETGNNSRTVTVYGLVDGDPGESWAEASITYNTAPAISLVPGPPPSTAFDSLRTVNLGTFGTTGSTSERLTFASAALDSFIAADTNGVVTFYLYLNGGGAVTVRPKESTAADANPNPAALNFPNAVPEPASLALAVLGTAALATVRRRRGLVG
jgi:hypothetical protein